MAKDFFFQYENGGRIFSFNKGGEVTDTCYINYDAYQMQNKRCEKSGTDYFLLGEYRDVSQKLRNDYTSQWIYYNRLARLYISSEQAEQLVKQLNKFFKPQVPIVPFFLEHDRSFATYRMYQDRPTEEIEIPVSMRKADFKGKNKLETDIEFRKAEARQERFEQQEMPKLFPDDFVYKNDFYWAICFVVNIGGDGDYGDNQYRNKILNEHIPFNNGISTMTLLHEYAHCLDFVRSIVNNDVEYVPFRQLDYLAGKDFDNNPISKEEMMYIKKMQDKGVKSPRILAVHEKEFVFELSRILRAGMDNSVPLLNEIENEAHQIEVKIGGQAYADKKRMESRNHFLEIMQKSIDKANIENLTKDLPSGFARFVKNTDVGDIAKKEPKQLFKEDMIKLKPFISQYKEFVIDTMYNSPDRQGRILKEIMQVQKETARMIDRT